MGRRGRGIRIRRVRAHLKKLYSAAVAHVFAEGHQLEELLHVCSAAFGANVLRHQRLHPPLVGVPAQVCQRAWYSQRSYQPVTCSKKGGGAEGRTCSRASNVKAARLSPRGPTPVRAVTRHGMSGTQDSGRREHLVRWCTNLVVLLDRLGDGRVNDEAHVGLVNP